MNSEKTKNKSASKKLLKKSKLISDKERYFSFYDDVKHFSKGKEDW